MQIFTADLPDYKLCKKRKQFVWICVLTQQRATSKGFTQTIRNWWATSASAHTATLHLNSPGGTHLPTYPY